MCAVIGRLHSISGEMRGMIQLLKRNLVRPGCANLPKVLNFMVIVDFPIHLDPRTSPSEKISKFFEIYYWSKRVEVYLVSYLVAISVNQNVAQKNP